ncbi:type I-E CRISPR-associated protein Cse2/CasB [Streptomyces eurythermus]|uniref:Type I-E CRISPR-associated protein Cse2/CasB n=1 Tax=Streptomyces lavenduligriseus TaxID=67315 RepID=A0ABT0NLR8_9ACTN|nr:type I-E CRISPR-associated protein Cse2/CasB [Streptomyces lavenduligriseus]MCL3992400.1 type I-E CRISPR-associated protein Cse2/CasB [Streptomyces lavenduligriseus]
MTFQAPEASKRQRNRATYAAFTEHIERLCRTDPGARAALRAGLRRDLDHPRTRPMHRLLTPRLPEGCDDKTAQAHYTVAALIAAQPRHTFSPDQGDDEDTADEHVAAEEQTSLQEGEPDEEVIPPGPTPYGASFGAALGQAVIAKGASMRKSAAESRISLLTRQSLRGIHLHLPAAVNQVRTTGTSIDWGQLLADLVDWPYQSGRISRRWLQDFYRITAGADQD